MDYNAYDYQNDQFAYERGRHFAALYQGTIKNNKKIRYEALDKFNEAVYKNYII